MENLSEGLTPQAYFGLVNVDPPSRYFKSELIIPWLHKILK
nr:alpha/beta hydrolase family protein [Parabacteroides goldsteinii]